MAKAWEVEGIAPEISLEVCARRIITTRFDEMMSFKRGAIDGVDIKFVHDLRVSSRRLHTAMLTFADCFPKQKQFQKHLKRVKHITKTMGAVRDLDVLIDRFQKDAQTMLETEQIGAQNLIAHLQLERGAKRKQMLKRFERLDTSGFAKRFLKFFQV
ncbi:CHAD domain-containing protein [Candidatus Poribacteria bacterium]|nr:CHAD domain-containing protein [Candidatus Poribacteria bacterium]